ncbi:MAG: thymidine phosphorylase [Planctomycetaceae bacterium]
MIPAQIIAAKRDGNELSDEQIAFFIQGFTDGSIPDYQMSALAMAIFLNGMTTRETAALTMEMLNSGTRLQWPNDRIPRVDKHSTGGVGDKVSIPLAPLLACCGLQVPMLSGRGLGPTGGTLDKLEAIPGFRTNLTLNEIHQLTTDVGCVITGASSELAPADRRLYSLRDVTGTVPSIPLITASIMSKKLAESPDALVLDVKFGSGAFMKTKENARRLAMSLVQTGQQMGVKTIALLTDMNQPLGRMCGNAVEIQESIDILKGAGPADVRCLTLELAAQLLTATEICSDHSAAITLATERLDDGSALQKYRRMVTAQGGHPDAEMQVAPASELTAQDAGCVSAIDTEAIGMAIIALGGGRKQMTDHVDHSVGIEMLVRIGQSVDRGQPLARIFSRSPQIVTDALRRAIIIGDATAEPDLIAETITSAELT